MELSAGGGWARRVHGGLGGRCRVSLRNGQCVFCDYMQSIEKNLGGHVPGKQLKSSGLKHFTFVSRDDHRHLLGAQRLLRGLEVTEDGASTAPVPKKTCVGEGKPGWMLGRDLEEMTFE